MPPLNVTGLTGTAEISVEDGQQTEEQNFYNSVLPATMESDDLTGKLDDVLTCTLLCINTSGSDFKRGCLGWWNKAVRLAISAGLNREDEACINSGPSCSKPMCSCRFRHAIPPLSFLEAKEDRRRVFWLLYCLDRHLALSFNRVLQIPDSLCEVYGRSLPPISHVF